MTYVKLVVYASTRNYAVCKPQRREDQLSAERLFLKLACSKQHLGKGERQQTSSGKHKTSGNNIVYKLVSSRHHGEKNDLASRRALGVLAEVIPPGSVRTPYRRGDNQLRQQSAVGEYGR